MSSRVASDVLASRVFAELAADNVERLKEKRK
jgi:hypothetical protein